jgi:hypothetical protein
VRDRLDAAAREVHVRDGSRVEDRERVEPLRRHVHVAAVGRRGGDEEDVLRPEELDQRVVEGDVRASHGRIASASGTPSPAGDGRDGR